MPSTAARDVLQATLERRAAQKRREMAAVQGFGSVSTSPAAAVPMVLPFARQVEELAASELAPRNEPLPFSQTLTGAIGESLYGVPVAGPAALGLGARLGAAGRYVTGRQPYGEALEEIQTGQEDFRRLHPEIAGSAQNAGSSIFAPAFGSSMGAQVVGNAAMGGLDAMARGQDPTAAGVVAGGIAGATHIPAIFAGMAAKTANREMLTLANDLKNGGFTPEEIWKKTGWFQGKDDKWRFEIPDEASRVPDKTIDALAGTGSSGAASGSAEKILQHPELYAAYPKLRNMDVYADYSARYPSYSGKYESGVPQTATHFGRDPQITMQLNALAGPEGPRSLMLHELQHPVQEIEGFARGGSPSEYAHGPMFDPKARELNEDLSKEITGDYIHPPQNVIRDMKYGDLNRIEAIVRKHGFRTINEAADFLTKQDEMRTPHGQYRRLAGEAEARNVQTRRNMTPEERRATPPWETQDVPDEQQIVRFRSGGGAQESRAKVPAAGRDVSSRDNGGPPLNSPAIVRKKKFETPFSDIKRDNPIEDVTATYTKGQKLLPEKPFDISQVPEGSHFVSTFGDRSGAGRRLTGIGGEKFDQPVDLWGGSGYAQRAHNPDEAGWASGKGVITKLQNKIRPLQETGKPVFLIHTGMAPVAVDFSSMTSNTLLQQMKNRPLSDAAKRVFDARMEAQWGKDHPARPDWPGLEAVEKGDYTMSGPERLKFVKLMDTDAMRKLGAPDVGAARWAITDPRQRNSPFLGTGSSIFRLGEGVGHNPTPLVGHPDYPSALTSKGGQYVGTLPEIIHGLEFFQDVKRGLKPGVTNESHIGRKFLMSPAIQRVSPEWVQRILNYLKSASGQKMGIAGAIGAGLLTAEQAQEMFGSEPGQEKT